jgi:hypothetical protein
VNRRTLFIAAVGLFCLANVTRGAFRARVAAPRFAAEGAAHYRYTEIVANGGVVPSLDRKAQWPEGLRVYRETSVGMEYLYGLVYRLLPGRKPDLARFVRFFTAFFFSLAVFPVAFFSADLWKRTSSGVLAAVFFAVSLPLVARSSGFELIRENVTLVFLIFHVYVFFGACSGGGWGRAMLSGVLLAAALATWQGTQFYLIPFLLFLTVRRVAVEVPYGERRAETAVAACVLAAGAAVPFLREGRFLLSLPAGFSAALLALELVDRLGSGLRAGKIPPADEADSAAVPNDAGRTKIARRRMLKLAAACAAFACIVAPGIMQGEHLAAYSHFFRLLFYKVKYLRKPTDPTLLPFEARAFWVGPFHSPDPLHIFVFALPIVLVLPNQAARLSARVRSGDFRALFVLVFLVLSFVLFLLMQRLLPLFGVFAAATAGGGALELGGSGRRRFELRPHGVLTVAVLCIMLLQVFAWEGRADVWRHAARALRVPRREKFVVYPVGGDVEGALLSWIGDNTDGESVIMAVHYLSPQILTYTGRATNLNDFFESPVLRRKAQRFLGLLYSSESRLLGFLSEQSSDYLLVGAAAGCDPTSDSPLYQAGLVNIPPGCAAYRLLFEPERLDSFDLVYENEMYRLFRVGRAPSPRAWPRSPLFYENELLWRLGGSIEDFYHTVMDIYALTSRGRRLLRSGRMREGEARLAEALRTFYFYPAWRALVDLYAGQRRLKERETLAAFAHRHDPNRVDVCMELAASRLDLGKREGVRELLERCSHLDLSPRQRAELMSLAGRLERIGQSSD